MTHDTDRNHFCRAGRRRTQRPSSPIMMGCDPDFDRSRFRSCAACLPPASMSSNWACPSPTRWRTAPPFRRASARCRRRQRHRAGHGPRLPPRRQRHAYRADGLLQPDLCPRGRRRRLLAEAAEAGVDRLIVVDLPPRKTANCACPPAAPASTSSAWRRPPMTAPAAGR